MRQTVLMTSLKDSFEVQRLEVVNTGRRRRWTLEEKLRIVQESCQGHRQVSATARRHDISPSLLFSWRKALGGACLGGVDEVRPSHGIEGQSGFAPAVVVPGEVAQLRRTATAGRMEILTVTGQRIIVGADVNAEALGRVVAALERR